MKKHVKIISVTAVALLVTGIVVGYCKFSANTAAASNQTEGKIIREKMLNAIDNYSYAKGSFVSTSSTGVSNQVEFEVEEGKNPGSKVTVKGQDGKILASIISDADSVVNKNETDKSFTKQPKVKWDTPPGSRKFKHADGNNAYVYRPDPASAGIAAEITFPQQIAFWLDDDEANYAVSGHEKLFGRDATVITGTMLKSMQTKAKSFVMHIDTETGVLLGLETTNSNGTPSISSKVQNITIDKKQHNSIFDTSTAPIGYQEKVREDLKKLVNK